MHTPKPKYPTTGFSIQAAQYSEFALNQSTSIDNLDHRILGHLKKLGFSDYIFLPLEKNWGNTSEGQQAMLSSYPEEYWRIYKENRLYTHDMLVSFFRDNYHPIFTSQIYDYYCNSPFDTELTLANRAIRQLQYSFGFNDSYAIPIRRESRTLLFIVSQRSINPEKFQGNIKTMTPQLRLLGNSLSKDATPSSNAF